MNRPLALYAFAVTILLAWVYLHRPAAIPQPSPIPIQPPTDSHQQTQLQFETEKAEGLLRNASELFIELINLFLEQIEQAEKRVTGVAAPFREMFDGTVGRLR